MQRAINIESDSLLPRPTQGSTITVMDTLNALATAVNVINTSSNIPKPPTPPVPKPDASQLAFSQSIPFVGGVSATVCQPSAETPTPATYNAIAFETDKPLASEGFWNRGDVPPNRMLLDQQGVNTLTANATRAVVSTKKGYTIHPPRECSTDTGPRC